MSKTITNAYSDAIQKKIHKNTVCWWCTYKFHTIPVCVPYKFDDKRCIFSLEGYFCSWQCGKAYVLDKNSADKFNQCTLITLLHKRMSGKITSVKSAPSRFDLEKFGGHLTIEQFRQNNTTISQSEFNKNEGFHYHPHGNSINNSINNSTPQATPKNLNKKHTVQNTNSTPLLLDENSINHMHRKNRKVSSIEQTPKSTKTSLESFMNITILK